MLNALLLSAMLVMSQQDTTKTRISSDTTQMPPDTTQVVDTTGWIMTDSLALTDTTVTIQPGGSFISEIWDYLITGLLGPTPPDTSPPIIIPPPIDPNQPPNPPTIVQGPGCTDMADSVSYLCTVQYQPDVMVDSTYWRRGSGQGSTWFMGDSLQWGYVSYPCTTISTSMDSRSYRNNLRSDPIVQLPVYHLCAGVTPPDTIPPPPINPPNPPDTIPPVFGSWDIEWKFDTGLAADSVFCYGTLTQPCDWTREQECAFPLSAFPPSAEGCYRKHSFLRVGGTGGSGAIVSHWQTGMPIGFSPVWLARVSKSYYFTMKYDVKQTAPMAVGLNGFPGGSNRKMNRMRLDPGGNLGTLMSYDVAGNAKWYWETWTSNDPVSASPLGFTWPTDGQWHTYQIELDFREIKGVGVIPNPGSVEKMYMTFWLDGKFMRTVQMGTRVGDRLEGVNWMYFSPFLEMYSCGSVDGSQCSPGINTGDYTVDNLQYKDLEPSP